MGIADDAKNTAEDLKGRAKEALGAATNNDDPKPKDRRTRELPPRSRRSPMPQTR